MKHITDLYYKTGEFAELAGLNRRTLHYYDQEGIFRPNHLGENGYRYYSVNQLDRLSLIIVLRDLGVSLKDIRGCLDQGDVEGLNGILEEQELEIDRMILQLQQRKQLLRTTLENNRDFARYLNRGYLVRELPEFRWEVILDIDRDKAKKRGAAKQEQVFSVVNYLTDGPDTGMYLSGGRHLLFQKRENGSHVMAAGRYLCSYQTLPEQSNLVERVEQEAEKLHRYGREQGIPLGESTCVEYNDIMAYAVSGGREQYLFLRAKIMD